MFQPLFGLIWLMLGISLWSVLFMLDRFWWNMFGFSSCDGCVWWNVFRWAVFDGLCDLTHCSHGLRAYCSYIILGFSGVFAFLPTNTSPILLHLTPPTTMSSSSMAPVPTASPSENLCNNKGLSLWELLQNHYLRLGSADRADYFPSVGCSLLIFHALFSNLLFPFRLLHWLLVLMLCVRILPLLIMM